MFRTSPVEPGFPLKMFKVGDKVKVFTTPWSPTNINGSGHHNLFNERVGTVVNVFDGLPYRHRAALLYHIRFKHCTYICTAEYDQLCLVD